MEEVIETKNVFDAKELFFCRLICQEDKPPMVKEAQLETVKKLCVYGKGFASSGVRLVIAIKWLNAKLSKVLSANSEEEARAYGEFCFDEKEKNYLAEEELLLLSLASKKGTLTKEAQNRFVSLYEKCKSN